MEFDLGLPLMVGLFGISLRKMFRNPFGKHSLFGRATQIASVLPIPGAGLIGKAFALANRARPVLQGRGVGPILRAGLALVPSQAPRGVMPGGALVRGARGRSTQRREVTRSRVARSRRRITTMRRARRRRR